jgi:hypothetical protein
MDKYKITSPKMEDLKRRKAVLNSSMAALDDEMKRESARLSKEKADALCAEMAAKKARR